MISNEKLRKRYFIVLGAGIVTIIGIMLLLFYQPFSYRDSKEIKVSQSMITGNTVRIEGKDYYETAAAISQITYPATFEEDKPNAVILVRGDKKADAIAAAGIIHHPINAPILYVVKENIPESTWAEMKRLDPQGVFVDGNIKVILVGDIGEGVKKSLKEKGWKFRHIQGNDPFTLGNNIDKYVSAIHGDHRDIVMIAPIEKPEYALVQASWNAHMGDAFFYIKRNEVPKQTVEALNRRYGGAYIYLMGSELDISLEVEKQLAQYGHVQRIPGGNNIYSLSVGFAGYKDIGRNFGWWIGKESRNFGWGIAEAGHNFIFVNPENWQSAVSASVLSHKGKHGPMLLIENNSIPNAVMNYLKTVQPYIRAPQEQLYNHGWIIGSSEDISLSIQVEIDRMLEGKRSERK